MAAGEGGLHACMQLRCAQACRAGSRAKRILQGILTRAASAAVLRQGLPFDEAGQHLDDADQEAAADAVGLGRRETAGREQTSPANVWNSTATRKQ